jgi:hypothetical protein
MDDIESNKITPINVLKQEVPPILSRATVLKMLGECISSVHHKLRVGRNRSTEKDKLKQEMLRVQGYLSSVYLAGLRDLEMQELDDRLKALEEAKNDHN